MTLTDIDVVIFNRHGWLEVRDVIGGSAIHQRILSARLDCEITSTEIYGNISNCLLIRREGHIDCICHGGSGFGLCGREVDIDGTCQTDECEGHDSNKDHFSVHNRLQILISVPIYEISSIR